MNRPPVCPECDGTGDEWHLVWPREPLEPFPCTACRGTGDRVERVTPHPGHVDKALTRIIYDLCGSPADAEAYAAAHSCRVFTHVADALGMSPNAVAAACARLVPSSEPELPF